MSVLATAVTFAYLSVGALGRGATVPWSTYEAETMTLSPGTTTLGPDFQPYSTASECSHRRCVKLSGRGQYVEFVAQAAANALIVRYSLPDSEDGRGIYGSLSLSVNAAQLQKLSLTSAYSYLYGGYPFTNQPRDGSPRGHFDEVRNFNVTIFPGDKVRLEHDANDPAPYCVLDFVDTELVAAPIVQPSGYLHAVKDCGLPIDGATNVLTSLQGCLSRGKPVYMPPGHFLLQGALSLPAGATLQGAGMWYTTFVGNPHVYGDANQRVGIMGSGSYSTLADFAILGWLTYRHDAEPNDGVGGHWGAGSRLARLWVEHTKTGFWLMNSDGLLVDSCRVRNTIADGINLCSAMRSTIVRNAAHRNTGDDSFAMWPLARGDYIHGDNAFVNCTGQLAWLAQGASIYGGVGNKVSGCLFEDYTYGCGVLVSSTFSVVTPQTGTRVTDTNVLRSGGFDQGHWRGAVQVYPDQTDISDIRIDNMNIHESASNGIHVVSPNGRGLIHAAFSHLDIPSSGIATSGCYSFYVAQKVWGDVTFSCSNIPTGFNAAANFKVTWIRSMWNRSSTAVLV